MKMTFSMSSTRSFAGQILHAGIPIIHGRYKLNNLKVLPCPQKGIDYFLNQALIHSLD